MAVIELQSFRFESENLIKSFFPSERYEFVFLTELLLDRKKKTGSQIQRILSLEILKTFHYDGEWLYVFTDGSKFTDNSNAGAGVFCYQGRFKSWANWASVTMGASFRSRLSFNKIIIRIIIPGCILQKNCEFRTKCQLVTCDNRHLCIDLGLTPYIIITHSIKRRQSSSRLVRL
ncbi:hypothetical protein TNCV_2556051 [Trichonephila clavipes]|nr:hypothetical protein TNCV_2556051 [Trichonephila clavipes]